MELLIIIFLSLACFCLFMIAKNENTYKQRLKIIKAEYGYNSERINNNDYEILDVELEPYNKTLYRLWDWGFKNIVDKESYEKIKDYL